MEGAYIRCMGERCIIEEDHSLDGEIRCTNMVETLILVIVGVLWKKRETLRNIPLAYTTTDDTCSTGSTDSTGSIDSCMKLQFGMPHIDIKIIITIIDIPSFNSESYVY